MIKQIVKSCVRGFLAVTNGKTVRVVAGPLRGRRLLRQHGLPNLSMLFGTYESRFAAAFSSRVRQNSVIYDIGANTGYFSLLAAEQHRPGGQVVAFEPVPAIVNDLRTMVAANGLDDRVQAFQLALSDSNGRIKMFTPASAATGIIQTAIGDRNISDETAIEVEVSTLDRFVFKNGNPAPEVIKLDVEGAEASVLVGARRVLQEKRPTILIEVHGEKPASDVWDIIVPLGYRVHLLTDSGELEIFDRATWVGHFAGSKWVINHCVLTPSTAVAAAA